MRLLFAVILAVLGIRASIAQDFNVSKPNWLTTLKSTLPIAFCRDPRLPFIPVYKGRRENCITDVEQLFDRCAYREPRVVIPDAITSFEQGDKFGKIVGDCIVAHYQGGAALNEFYKRMEMSNKRD